MRIYSIVMILYAWSVAAETEININKDPVIKKRGECVEFQEEHRFPVIPESKFEWKKYKTSSVANTNRIFIPHDQKTMRIRQVRLEDSAIYSSTVRTKGGRESTNYWLEVQGCDINEKEIEFSGCNTACKAMCEEGWYHFNDKCYKYFSTPKTWLDAYYYCQAVHGSKLATIDNQEENRFVGTLLKSGDGGWIGLNDRSKESNFLWNYNKFSQPSFFAWDKKDPKNPEPNNFNAHCNVEMCAELKQLTKKWNDVVCKAQIEYVCEKNSDQDIPGWRCRNGKCYFYVREKVVWEWARRGCTNLNSTMLTIESLTENKYVGGWIKGNVWLGLNDRVEAGLYVWNDIGQGEFSNRPTYLNWDVGEPNDKHYNRKSPERCKGEDCVQIKSRTGVVSWYDLNCNTALPFICENSRDPYLSFAAWIALSMGAGLILSIFGGRIYMEYRQRRGGKEVKQMMAATLDKDEGKD